MIDKIDFFPLKIIQKRQRYLFTRFCKEFLKIYWIHMKDFNLSDWKRFITMCKAQIRTGSLIARPHI